MNLIIGSWFEQPQVEFKISHKVTNLIRDLINQDIFKPKGIYNVNDNDFVAIQITTNKSIKHAFLDQPTFDSKNSVTNYNFWLPYYKIKKSKNELESFVEYFFNVLEKFLEIYAVPKEDVEKLKSKTKHYLKNAEEYQYEEKDDVDMNDILKDLGIE